MAFADFGVLLVATFGIILPHPILTKSVLRTFPSQPATSHPNALQKRLSVYGEACQVFADCTPDQGLSCTNGTCFCSSSHIARLNPDKSLEVRTECVIRAGSECDLSPPGEELKFKRRTFSTIWSKLRQNLPFLDGVLSDSNCVDNARCIQGICTCSSDYFRDGRDLCLKKRTLFQPCDNDDHCLSGEGLMCNQGKCDCRKSMIFDRFLRKCYLPVGSKCDAYASDIDMECVRNSECTNGYCECLEESTPSSDGTCGVAHGQICDGKERICSDIQLTCRSGKCQCEYPIHQIYNETSGWCLSKPDGPCRPELANDEGRNFGRQKCVQFAECVQRPENASNSLLEHYCRCIDGYAEDQAGECSPSYSSPCVDDDDCDQVARLTCVNGKCQCPDDMLVFDWKRRKCVGMVGARCRFIQIERFLAMRVDIPTECVAGASCSENVFRLDGRCECRSGYKFSKSNGSCLK